jgi:DNA modification methylase
MEMVINAIEASSDKGDLVLDLFLGSGTTMLASAQIGRTCFGMEKEPRYCQIIINRMIEQNPTLEVKINGKIWERQIENSEA